MKRSRMRLGGLRQFLATARTICQKIRNPQRRRRMNGLRRPQAQNQPGKLQTRRDILIRHEFSSYSWSDDTDPTSHRLGKKSGHSPFSIPHFPFSGRKNDAYLCPRMENVELKRENESGLAWI